jgi:hypothetical protein
MNNEPTTIDTIIAWLNDVVENKRQVSPTAWVDIAQKANILLGNETDSLAELSQTIAKERLRLMEEGATASKAKIATEATDDYKTYSKLKAKISRVEELIRLSKVVARLKDNEYRNSNFQT